MLSYLVTVCERKENYKDKDMYTDVVIDSIFSWKSLAEKRAKELARLYQENTDEDKPSGIMIEVSEYVTNKTDGRVLISSITLNKGS